MLWMRRSPWIRWPLVIVGGALWFVTLPLLLDDVPEGLHRWNDVLASAGGGPVEITVVLVTALMVLIGALGPALVGIGERAAGGVPGLAAQEDSHDKASRRAARRVISELKASRQTAETALDRGHWWYVVVEGLQFGEWQENRDLLADYASKAHDAAAEAYVHVERLNAAANNAYVGDVDELGEDDRLRLTIFMGLAAQAIKKLQRHADR
jgi:hypothetical protein